MDRVERIYRLHALLDANRRYGVTLEQIKERLECSRATAVRTIRDLRNYLGAPLVWNPKLRRYRYEEEGRGPWQLPGLWLGADELHALLAAERLLEQVEPGLLEPELAPLRRRIRALLQRLPGGSEALAGRVRLAPIGRRAPNPEAFRTVADALARKRRLRITYHGRASDEETERTVSPQRL
ncbi:MAG TPA: HTH domain-containing protein, partial [Rhodospirillales bacterium]|nr:HTH domain-containing protein [Rhodospirillales bacterium]